MPPTKRKTASGRIADHLRDRILAGHYRPGAPLPGRRAIGREYDCGAITVEAAIKSLVDEGYVRAEDRRGTFVADSLPGVGANTQSPQTASHSHFPKGALVGVVTPIVIGDPSHVRPHHDAYAIVSSFERYISEFNGVTQVFAFNDLKDHVIKSVEATEAAIEAGCDAILLAMHFGEDHERIVQMAETAGIQVVFAGSKPVREPAISVHYDNVGAGYQAADHLLSNGARSLAVFGHVDEWWVHDRVLGAQQALNQERRRCIAFRVVPDWLADNTAFVPDGDVANQQEWSYRLACGVLNDGLPAEGIVAVNDHAAIGFMRAARERGWLTGTDYVIIGFDDHEDAKLQHLSTMQPPWDAMGREAARLLVAKRTEPRSTPSRVCLPSYVVTRPSSRIKYENT